MKKKLIVMIAAALALIGQAHAMNRLTADNVTIEAGGTAVLSVGLDNDDQIGGFQFFVNLPDGIEVESQSLTDRMGGTLMANKDGDTYKFACFYNGTAATGNTGTIVNIVLSASEDVAVGDYDVTLTKCLLSDDLGKDIIVGDVDFTITVVEAEVKQKDVITWNIDLSNYELEKQYPLEATAESGLAVSYSLEIIEGSTIKGEESVEIITGGRNKKYLVIYEDCLFNITASTEGNDEYSPASVTYQIRFANGKCTECTNLSAAQSTDLMDGTPYENDTDLVGVNITYTRNYKSTGWQALYLPFVMNYSEWEQYGEVAQLFAVHQYTVEDNGFDLTTIEFRRLKAGENTQANIPYVFKPKAAGEVTFKCLDRTLYAAPATDPSVSCSSTTTIYTIYGNYEVKSGLPAMGAYALSSEGQFVKAQSSTQTLNPYRIYMLLSPNPNGYGSGSSAQHMPERIVVSVDGEIDGIESIISDIMTTDGAAYDLQGRRVGTNAQGLIIVNGQKKYQR